MSKEFVPEKLICIVGVAGFIGSPAMNMVEGAEAAKAGATTIGVRPEHFVMSHESGQWRGRVGVAEHLGSDTFLHVEVEGVGPVTARATGEFEARHGDTVFLTPEEGRVYRFGPDGLAL